MFVVVKCPRCKVQFNIDDRGMDGKEIKCAKCKHYFTFVSKGKQKTGPEWPLAGAFRALREFLTDVAVKIGLVAFYDRIKGWLPGTGIALGFLALVLTGVFLVRLFAPEAPILPGTEHEGGAASVKGTGKETPQDKDAQWALTHPLSYHSAKLRSTDPAVKIKSARALGSMGRAAEPALGDLLAAANDSRSDVQTAVERALRAIGPPAKNNWKWIAQALSAKAKAARMWALRLLAMPEHAVVAELPGVIPSLTDPDPEVSDLAAKALATLQAKDRKTVMSRLFEEKTVATKLYVTQHLAEPGKATLADVPGLVKFLNEPDQEVRIAATKALDSFPADERKSVLLALAQEKGQGPAGPLYVANFLAKPDSEVIVETVPSLLEWLSAPNPELQKQSALALANFGPEHAGKVRNNPKLLGLALKHKAKPARTWALQLLATPENAVLEQLPGVIGFLSDPELSPLAEKALANFQAKDRNSVINRLFEDKAIAAKLYVTGHLAQPGNVTLADLPGLTKCLSEPNQELRRQTAKALDSYPAEERKSVLLTLAKEEEPAPRMYVAQYLARADEGLVPEVIPSLLEWISVPNRELQSQAALALAQFGPDHADKIRPSLMALLPKNQDEQLTKALCATVRTLGPPPREDFDTLKTLTKDARAEVRFFGWEMLARMDLNKADVLKTFPPLFKDPEPRLRALALDPIAKLGNEGAALLADLKTLLDDPDPLVRSAAARNLAALGKAAAPALNQLAKALADEDPAVRVHATWALVALGKNPSGLAGFSLHVDEAPSRLIWTDGRHNGAPALVRWGDHYYGAWCNAASPKGTAAKILVCRSSSQSPDQWAKVAEFTQPALGPDSHLVVVGERLHVYWNGNPTFVSTSADGLKWTPAKIIGMSLPKGADVQHLGRIRPGPDGALYSLARCGVPDSDRSQLLLLRSKDGLRFKAVHNFGEGINELLAKLGREPRESDLLFLETGALAAAIRTDKTGVIAFSDAPLQKWRGFDSNIKDFGGPSLWKNKSGVLLACRTPAACTIFSVTPTALAQPFVLPNSGLLGPAYLAPGLTEDEPLLIYAAQQKGDDSPGATVYLGRLKIRTSRVVIAGK